MGVIEDTADTGSEAVNDPSGFLRMVVMATLTVSVVGGIMVAGWRMVGSRVAGTAGNVVRGVSRLGAETVESGTGIDVTRTGGS